MFVNYCEVRQLLPDAARLTSHTGVLVLLRIAAECLIERREGKCVGQAG